jgi:hypothetical protein
MELGLGWMQHCVEIAEDFQSGQGTPGAYFYIFRPGFDLLRRLATEGIRLMNYILHLQRIYTTE